MTLDNLISNKENAYLWKSIAEKYNGCCIWCSIFLLLDLQSNSNISKGKRGRIIDAIANLQKYKAKLRRGAKIAEYYIMGVHDYLVIYYSNMA